MITSIPGRVAEKLRKKPFFIYFLDKVSQSVSVCDGMTSVFYMHM